MGAFSTSFGFGFGDPGIGGGSGFPSGVPSASPASTSGNTGSDAQNWLRTIFPFLQLGTQTYLAQDALGQSRPATLTYNALGQPVVTGGGALPLAAGGVTASIAPYLPLIVILVVLIVMVKK
jgi:hypothetical protein